MTTMNTQFGIVDEVTYGTPVTVSRFYEYESENIRPQQGRVESRALRSGTRVLRSDRFEPYRVGAAGPVRIPVPTKGFGLMLKHMMGTAAIGSVSDLNYTQTFTIGSLYGDMFTAQLNRPFNPSGTDQPFTYHGGKVTDWTLSCDLDDYLVADIGMDFEDEDTSTSLASASYSSDFRLFSFAGASLTVEGSSVEVKNISVSANNGLKTDRRYLRSSSLKKEPVENGMRVIEWSCTADFADLTQRNRFTSTTRTGALATLVATFDGPIAHAGTTLPQLKITIEEARFDAAHANVSGPPGLEQELGGIATFDGTNSAVKIEYRTTDSAA